MTERCREDDLADASDPRQAILGGAKLLGILSEKYKGDVKLTLAAYNAGSGAVDKHGGIPPYAETQKYVPLVLSAYERFKAQSTPATPGTGTTLTLTAPPNVNVAPPGYYMLFLINRAGVPSVARWVQLTPTPGNQPPRGTITAPTADVTIRAGQSVTFAGSGTDADGSVTAHAWTFPGGTPRSSTVATVRMRRPSFVSATTSGVTVESWMVTVRTRPELTSARNSEYGRYASPGRWRPSNCLNTVNRTSAITSQIRSRM